MTPDSVANERLVDDHLIAFDRLMEDEPVAADLRTPEQRRVHASAWATAGLIASVIALATTFTGLLAPLGFALGIVCVVMCVGSLAAVRHPNVTGRGLAIIGVITALAAVVFAVLAMSGDYIWPNSGTDEIDRLHTWLNELLPWLKRW